MWLMLSLPGAGKNCGMKQVQIVEAVTVPLFESRSYSD